MLIVEASGRSGILLQGFSYSSVSGHEAGQSRASGYKDDHAPSVSVV